MSEVNVSRKQKKLIFKEEDDPGWHGWLRKASEELPEYEEGLLIAADLIESFSTMYFLHVEEVTASIEKIQKGVDKRDIDLFKKGSDGMGDAMMKLGNLGDELMKRTTKEGREKND